MKPVTEATKDAWLSGEYTGATKPMVRTTIQKLNIYLATYKFDDRFTELKRTGSWASAIFGQQHTPIELPNLASMKYNRDVTSDVATAELTFYNTAPLPLGQVPDAYSDFDQPGYYTGERGNTEFSDRWDHTSNGWQGLLVPDRVLRTYEGYGFNPEVGPESDANLYPSGVWLIDEVDYTSVDGMIRVTCRDLGRLLLEHIHFPPVVPFTEYPLYWDHYHQVDNPDVPVITTGPNTRWVRPSYHTDSNQPYVSHPEITDGGMSYVQANGAVYGHHGSDAFDGSASTYFLSVGNQATWSSAYEFVQGKFPKGRIGAVKVNAKAGPYRCYISVWADGGWKGTKRIPYGSRVVDTHADINYVKAVSIAYGENKTIRLPKVYANATRVRVTFSRLWNSGLGVNYKYRAAIEDVQVLLTTQESITTIVDGGQHWEGNYADYTDIVKWLCAWAGFLLPANPDHAFVKKVDGTKVTYEAEDQDVVLGSLGRVWGDFENTGTYGPAKLDIPTFDKKPLMDGIAYVRDIIGFSFWIDETGGAIWRSPNIWTVGNYVQPLIGGPSSGRTSLVLEIDEKQTLTSLTAKLSSRNTRERVFVANFAGRHAAMASGFNPYPSGMRRVGGWTDQNFASDEECQVMADLITLRQAFTYRENTIVIPGNPQIQIDDQVRIFERVAEEGYYHYVKSISSDWSLATGEWRYTLGTHWLGETPFTRWAFDPAELSAETQAYLEAIGKV